MKKWKKLKQWTKEEEEVIKKHYDSHNFSSKTSVAVIIQIDLLKTLNSKRSLSAIWHRAHRLELKTYNFGDKKTEVNCQDCNKKIRVFNRYVGTGKALKCTKCKKQDRQLWAEIHRAELLEYYKKYYVEHKILVNGGM